MTGDVAVHPVSGAGRWTAVDVNYHPHCSSHTEVLSSYTRGRHTHSTRHSHKDEAQR